MIGMRGVRRRVTATRHTRETNVTVTLDLDGSGTARVTTGIGFFDHMLAAFAKHSLFDLAVRATGDLQVDWHHTIEDVGLVCGQAFQRAIGTPTGVVRYGFAAIPLDEALSLVAVDICSRPFLVYEVTGRRPRKGEFDTDHTREFLRALSNEGRLTLHVRSLGGHDQHHVNETIFKALGRALGQATRRDPRVKGVASTKGRL